jgi:hypothetical protein
MCKTFPPNQREACDIPNASIKVGAGNRFLAKQTASSFFGGFRTPARVPRHISHGRHPEPYTLNLHKGWRAIEAEFWD